MFFSSKVTCTTHIYVASVNILGWVLGATGDKLLLLGNWKIHFFHI